jgi:prephenate dehydrogenase
MAGRTAAVIGTGLIGSSIGAGLRHAGWHVVGYDADEAVAGEALERELVDAVAPSIERAVSSAEDLVVVAAPPMATIEILSGLDTEVVVMDVSGVKEPIVRAAAGIARFAATHPMAGRETSGPAAASGALFSGATWVVATESDAAAAEVAIDVIETLGARPVWMAAADHDRAVAVVSHLPQVVAGSLLAAASSQPAAIDLAAGSFRDLTRVGASLPLPWVEILRTNRDAVLAAIGSLREQLAEVEAAIVSEDDRLLTMLSTSRDVRLALGSPMEQVRIALADQPGELAKAGHAFEASGVDIRDLQMRHASHGGGGVLTISVRPGEAGALRMALEREGLLVIP